MQIIFYTFFLIFLNSCNFFQKIQGKALLLTGKTTSEVKASSSGKVDANTKSSNEELTESPHETVPQIKLSIKDYLNLCSAYANDEASPLSRKFISSISQAAELFQERKNNELASCLYQISEKSSRDHQAIEVLILFHGLLKGENKEVALETLGTAFDDNPNDFVQFYLNKLNDPECTFIVSLPSDSSIERKSDIKNERFLKLKQAILLSNSPSSPSGTSMIDICLKNLQK